MYVKSGKRRQNNTSKEKSANQIKIIPEELRKACTGNMSCLVINNSRHFTIFKFT